MEKIPVILVACMLLFSTLDVLALDNSVSPTECCVEYRSKRLPKNSVASFQRTNVQCRQDGVVFTMKNGARICTDPTLNWVQKVISHVRSKTPAELGSGGL